MLYENDPRFIELKKLIVNFNNEIDRKKAEKQQVDIVKSEFHKVLYSLLLEMLHTNNPE